MKRVMLGIGFLLSSLASWSQSAYAPLNTDYYHLFDRYEIKSGQFSESFFTTYKPFRREQIAAFMDSTGTTDIYSSKSDKFNQEYLNNDNWEFTRVPTADSKKPFLKKLYRKKSELFHVDHKHFDLHLSPILYWSIGNDTDSQSTLWTNSRGLEIRGRIDEKVAFYTRFTENQAVFPGYIQSKTFDEGALPNEGFWKRYNEDGVDWFSVAGYIDFNITRHINMQFGQDKNFIGNGIRSLVLSDYGANYLFLKITTQVWRLQYTNLWTQMVANSPFFDGGNLGVDEFPKKFTATHHLGINISDNFNIGLFESVVFGRQDSLGNNNFQLYYLNPIIFYRAVEQHVGSPDNVILGMDFKWNFARHYSFYGQATLDEFKVSEVFSSDGWWANKYAFQLGVKYIDVFNIPNLDLQVEGNMARPYTYTHDTIFTNVAHYRQPLAHPSGANFVELIGLLRYQPFPRLNLIGKLIYRDQGIDEGEWIQNGTDWEGTNHGGNVLLSYNTRESEYGNETGQGFSTQTYYIDFRASYMLKHNFIIDFQQRYRKVDSESEVANRETIYTALSLRWNIPIRLHDF